MAMTARAAVERSPGGLRRAAGRSVRSRVWLGIRRRVRAGRPVRLVVVARRGGPGRGEPGGKRQRHRRGRTGQGFGEGRRGAQRRPMPVRLLEQRPAGHLVDAGRDARGHLTRRAQAGAVLRRRRQQCWRRPGGARLAGPVAGQRGVEQPGQVLRVGEFRVVRAVLGRGQGRPGQRGVDAEPGDLHPAAYRPVHAGRVQPEVRQADFVRGRDRPRCLHHHRGRAGRIERALGEHVEQRRHAHPLQHHVGQLFAVLHVEHLGEARVAEPARGPGGGHRLGHPGKTGREREHGDRTGEGLVRGFPVRPAGARGDLVDKTVPSCQPGSGFRRVCAHRLPPMLMPAP